MPQRSTEEEKRLLQTLLCPDCDALIVVNATRCRQCGLLLALGALGMRMPHHAKPPFTKRDWIKRFLKG